MHTTQRPEDFWSDIYHGRAIAVLHHGSGWLAYLDHVLQPRMVFATAEAAVHWLHSKIDRPKGARRLH